MNLPFLLGFNLYLRTIFQVQAPGGLIFEGAIKRRVFALPVWGGLNLEGLIFGILRYFTIETLSEVSDAQFMWMGFSNKGFFCS